MSKLKDEVIGLIDESMDKGLRDRILKVAESAELVDKQREQERAELLETRKDYIGLIKSGKGSTKEIPVEEKETSPKTLEEVISDVMKGKEN